MQQIQNITTNHKRFIPIGTTYACYWPTPYHSTYWGVGRGGAMCCAAHLTFTSSEVNHVVYVGLNSHALVSETLMVFTGALPEANVGKCGRYISFA